MTHTPRLPPGGRTAPAQRANVSVTRAPEPSAAAPGIEQLPHDLFGKIVADHLTLADLRALTWSTPALERGVRAPGAPAIGKAMARTAVAHGDPDMRDRAIATLTALPAGVAVAAARKVATHGATTEALAAVALLVALAAPDDTAQELVAEGAPKLPAGPQQPARASAAALAGLRAAAAGAKVPLVRVAAAEWLVALEDPQVATAGPQLPPPRHAPSGSSTAPAAGDARGLRLTALAALACASDDPGQRPVGNPAAGELASSPGLRHARLDHFQRSYQRGGPLAKLAMTSLIALAKDEEHARGGEANTARPNSAAAAVRAAAAAATHIGPRYEAATYLLRSGDGAAAIALWLEIALGSDDIEGLRDDRPSDAAGQVFEHWPDRATVNATMRQVLRDAVTTDARMRAAEWLYWHASLADVDALLAAACRAPTDDNDETTLKLAVDTLLGLQEDEPQNRQVRRALRAVVALCPDFGEQKVVFDLLLEEARDQAVVGRFNLHAALGDDAEGARAPAGHVLRAHRGVERRRPWARSFAKNIAQVMVEGRSAAAVRTAIASGHQLIWAAPAAIQDVLIDGLARCALGSARGGADVQAAAALALNLVDRPASQRAAAMRVARTSSSPEVLAALAKEACRSPMYHEQLDLAQVLLSRGEASEATQLAVVAALEYALTQRDDEWTNLVASPAAIRARLAALDADASAESVRAAAARALARPSK